MIADNQQSAIPTVTEEEMNRKYYLDRLLLKAQAGDIDSKRELGSYEALECEDEHSKLDGLELLRLAAATKKVNHRSLKGRPESYGRELQLFL